MINGLNIYYSVKKTGEGLKPVSTNNKQKASGLKPISTKGSALKPISTRGKGC